MEITTDVSAREVEPRIELVATILLGVATVAIALATYRGTYFDDRVAEKFHDALVENGVANDAFGRYDTTLAYEQSLFINWVTTEAGSFEEAQYERMMDDALYEATLRWLDDPDQSVASPFEYDDTFFASDEQFAFGVDALDVADRLELEAEQADEAGDSLALAQVLFAITLFSAGISVVLKRRATQNAVFVMGTTALMAGSVFFALGESM